MLALEAWPSVLIHADCCRITPKGNIMEYLLITVRVMGTDVTLLMTESQFNFVKDWFFEANNMTIIYVDNAASKGVQVK
jgi:hypothetical protein